MHLRQPTTFLLLSLTPACAGQPPGAGGTEPALSAEVARAAPTPVGSGALGAAAPSLPAPASSATLAPFGPETVEELKAEVYPPVTDDAPRVYAKARYVWVRYEPHVGAGWTGFLWLGGWAKLKDPNPVKGGGGGCPAWYAVEPRGYVCVDGTNATLDRTDPVLVGLLPYAPKLERAYPHHYGESRDAQRYMKIPDRKEQGWREPGLDDHLARVAAMREGAPGRGMLEGVDVSPAPDLPFALPELPPTLREDRSRLKYTSTVSWSREVLGPDGRSWLLAGDLKVAPKDRVAPYPISDFHGVTLGDDVSLPLAYFRGKDRAKYRREGDGEFRSAGDTFARLSWVGLTGKSEKVGKTTYLETKEPGVYVDAADAVVPTPQEKTPWGAPVGGEDTSGRTPAGRATWIEASVLGGWLIAYEGTKPVYVTMIAPGRGGIPERGKDPLETAATPTGVFPITGKFATATMVAPNEFIHSDVPWAQNFHGPHAIHTAYWHDRWGEKMSAGCVNVSNIDGRWLFYWTDPRLPAGWHGTRWEPSLGPATTFVVHS